MKSFETAVERKIADCTEIDFFVCFMILLDQKVLPLKLPLCTDISDSALHPHAMSS